jgi:hypothetical protein
VKVGFIASKMIVSPDQMKSIKDRLLKLKPLEVHLRNSFNSDYIIYQILSEIGKFETTSHIDINGDHGFVPRNGKIAEHVKFSDVDKGIIIGSDVIFLVPETKKIKKESFINIAKTFCVNSKKKFFVIYPDGKIE